MPARHQSLADSRKPCFPYALARPGPTARILRLVLSILVGVIGCQEQPIRTTITNEASPRHQAVAGTKVSLIPPPEFASSANFAGFEQEETGSSIMVMDVPGDFATLRNAFTPEVMRTQGLELIRSEDLVINGREAFLVDAEQAAYGMIFNKCVLGLNTRDGIVMINGVYPRELSEDLADHIRASITSVVFDAQRSVNP
ncbi:MAG: hypothetical protein R3330_13670, partial [Saprospiraceae bacterium]|nr:hypothetical protein [Saprospiraceae bacterium]